MYKALLYLSLTKEEREKWNIRYLPSPWYSHSLVKVNCLLSAQTHHLIARTAKRDSEKGRETECAETQRREAKCHLSCHRGRELSRQSEQSAFLIRPNEHEVSTRVPRASFFMEKIREESCDECTCNTGVHCFLLMKGDSGASCASVNGCIS